ncbi:hypothetical protein BKA70DRAFT_1425635 [Coprinopsis sp. MPI-PUGE-AT-0042]|nr:hypothetical protein BKA70DRAFT_1425635 [Coprinopsis sp. MPI-PUGE-AT-0042]
METDPINPYILGRSSTKMEMLQVSSIGSPRGKTQVVVQGTARSVRMRGVVYFVANQKPMPNASSIEMARSGTGGASTFHREGSHRNQLFRNIKARDIQISSQPADLSAEIFRFSQASFVDPIISNIWPSPSAEDPIRFGLVAFRDHPPQDTSYVTKKFGFTSSVGEMKKWLGGLVASGGGDGPEASTAAMADALNMDWRQSEEDEAEGKKKGVKAVKIVVLVTDTPPHGLGESGDGFPKGAPDQNDLLEIARQMAEHGISLYVIACGPTVSYYQHAVDFYRALTEITSGRMVPLLNTSQLGDYIIGSALETLATEELIAQFQDTILEDVYGQGKSVEEVVERIQQQLAQQKVQLQTLQVDDVYAPSKEAEVNVFSWKNAGKPGDARGMVQEISAPRMKAEYASAPGMGSFGGGAVPSGRMWASTPCGATPRGSAPPGSSAFGSATRSLFANQTGLAFGMGGSSSPRAAVGADLIEADELEAEEDERPEDFAPRRRKGKASMREREADRSYAPSSAYGAPSPRSRSKLRCKLRYGPNHASHRRGRSETPTSPDGPASESRTLFYGGVPGAETLSKML